MKNNLIYIFLKLKDYFKRLNEFSQYIVGLIPYVFLALAVFWSCFFAMSVSLPYTYRANVRASADFMAQCMFAVPAVLLICAAAGEYILKEENKL